MFREVREAQGRAPFVTGGAFGPIYKGKEFKVPGTPYTGFVNSIAVSPIVELGFYTPLKIETRGNNSPLFSDRRGNRFAFTIDEIQITDRGIKKITLTKAGRSKEYHVGDIIKFGNDITVKILDAGGGSVVDGVLETKWLDIEIR